jgi:peptidoglycan biosynthesis protein MviN/MurJ (putative lipid II flippase)
MGFRTIGLVFLFSVLGKILGFLRLQAFAFALGPTAYTDALLMALTILFAFDAIFVSGSAVILAQTELIRRDATHGARSAYAAFTRWMGRWTLLATLFGLACALFPDLLLAMIAPEFNAERRALFGKLLLVGALLPGAQSLLVFVSTINRVQGREALYASNQLVTNALPLIAIFAATALRAEPAQIASAVIASTLAGCIGMIAVQFARLDRGTGKTLVTLTLRRMRPARSMARLRTTARSLLLPGPLIAGLLLQQVLVLISYSFAARLGEGMLAVVGFGERIVNVIMMLLVGSMLVVLEPRWARALTGTQGGGPISALRDVRLIWLVLLPVSAVIVGCGDALARLLFGYGAFSGAATEQLGEITRLFGLALPGLSMALVFSRLLVIAGKVRVIVLGSLALVAVHWVACTLMVERLGLIGIPLALTVASLTQAGWLGILVVRSLPRDLRNRVRGSALHLVPVIAAVGLSTWFTSGLLDSDIANLLVTAAVACAAGWAAAAALGLHPIADMRALGHR